MNKQKIVDVVGVSSVTDKTGAVVEKTESLGLVVVEGPLAEVNVELGFTKNLGNYQSARLQVGIKVPSNIQQDALDSSFEYAKQWCDAKLQSMIKELEESIS